MNYKTVSIIKALVCLAFGPTLLIIPGFVLGLFGLEIGPAANMIGRAYGAALLGNMLLTYLSRNAEPSKLRKVIIWDLFAYDLAGFIAILILQLQGVMNFLGWGIVIIYLFFSIGYGLFLLPKKSAY
jgi:hypothetical protein